MATKTWSCPSCTCLNLLPVVDQDGADLKCVACKLEIHLDPDGKLNHGAIAPRS